MSKRKGQEFDEGYGERRVFGAALESDAMPAVAGIGAWGALRMVMTLLAVCAGITCLMSATWVVGEKMREVNRAWDAAGRELRFPCCVAFYNAHQAAAGDAALTKEMVSDCAHVLDADTKRSGINRCEFAASVRAQSRAFQVAAAVWRYYFPLANYSPTEIFASGAASLLSTWIWQYIVRRAITGG
jgi:hypothetical protein